MKIIKIIAVILLCNSYTSLVSQVSNPSHTKFNYTDLLDYTSNCRADVEYRINNAILSGRLKAYNDKKLKQKLPINAYFNKIAVGVNLTIPNPDNPDDIYDLIDTVVVSYKEASIFKFIGRKIVECKNKEDSTFYISYKNLKKILDKRLISTIDFYLENGLETISDYKLVPFCFEQTKRLCKKLYNYGINGDVKMYVFDSLKHVYSLEEITERTSTKENIQHRNPHNPDDKYDLIDTVITTYFNPDSINTIHIYYSWETENFVSQAKFYAIAPIFKPVAAGIELPQTSIFLIKKSDYLKKLNKKEKAFWQYFYTYILQNRSSGGIFEYYTEDNSPNGN